MTQPKCSVCDMGGYWVAWVDSERGYRCMNHIETERKNDE